MPNVIRIQEGRLTRRDSQDLTAATAASRQVTIQKLIELLRDCPFEAIRAELAGELLALLGLTR